MGMLLACRRWISRPCSWIWMRRNQNQAACKHRTGDSASAAQGALCRM